MILSVAVWCIYTTLVLGGKGNNSSDSVCCDSVGVTNHLFVRWVGEDPKDVV